MDNDAFYDATRAVMSDQDYQTCMLRTADIWLLMSACQMMQVEPGLHPPIKDLYLDLGKRLQAVVVAIHPEAKELAARGWDTMVKFRSSGIVWTPPPSGDYRDDDDDDDYRWEHIGE